MVPGGPGWHKRGSAAHDVPVEWSDRDMGKPLTRRQRPGMLARVPTGAVHGVDALIVHAEVNIDTGLPVFTVVGLAQGSVREGRERVTAALKNTGFEFPYRRITVNLAPADVRKEGTAFDLPIAIGVLAAAGAVPLESIARTAFVGELGLDGSLRPVAAVLPIAACCKEAGFGWLVVPEENAREAAVVEGLNVLGARHVDEVAAYLKAERPLATTRVEPGELLDRSTGRAAPDFSEVRGQALAKRVLEVAAAGAHNLLMLGPPGAGKTMLARCLPGILPPLTLDEALETTRVHSVAGLLRGSALVTRRPFRAPHHSVSYAGLVGGGAPLRPGEVSLAHHGVLFLDELAEYRRNVLEVLRQPLEDGTVRLARARASVRFPARFLMVAAMNPCPCGFWGDGTDRCLCDLGQVVRYRGRVSGPLLDRIDLHVHVPPVPFETLVGTKRGSASREVASRVATARTAQSARFSGVDGVHANGHMGPGEMRRHCRPSRPVARLLQQAVDRLGLSARAYHRVLKVARTIADLDGEEAIAVEHAAEAVQYRCMDRVEG